MRVTVNNDNNLSRATTNQVLNQQHQSYQQPNHIDDIMPSGVIQNYSESNFYCSVCDQHCNQEQLTYIIVRIPACVSCSTNKVAIIDDEHQKNNEHDYDGNEKPNVITDNIIICNNESIEKVELRRSSSPTISSLAKAPTISHRQQCDVVDDTASTPLNESVEEGNIIVDSENSVENIVTKNVLKLDKTKVDQVKIENLSKIVKSE